jgi:hypothetical protein
MEPTLLPTLCLLLLGAAVAGREVRPTEIARADWLAPGTGVETLAALPVDLLAAGWITRPEDNLVGLREPANLSNPAKVDFAALMDATEEMQQMRRDRIDPASPQGIQLKTRARTRIAGACERVMQSRGHCSVWKAVSHTDGRAVADVTEQVRGQL